jgi:hypothetical protein
VGKKILQGSEQEGPEFSQLRIGPLMDLVLDQVGKKTLGQVLGVVDGMAAAPDIGVERWPVGLTKLGQRRARGLGICLSLSRRDNHTPVGGSEGISLARNGCRRILHPATLTIRRANAKRREKNAISCSSGSRTRL